jgi:hypothetical protein
MGYPYFAWAGYYERIGLAAATAIPVAAAVGSVAWLVGSRSRRRGTLLALERDEQRVLLFALGLVLVALFLITGTHAPLGGFKGYVVSRLHLEGPFRSVYQRFGVYLALGYGPLVGAGIGALQVAAGRVGRLHAAGRIVALAAIVLIAVVPAWPMWSGRIMDSSGFSPARRVTVPGDYQRVAGLLDATPGDFDALTLPFGGFGPITLHWGLTNRGFYDRSVSRGYNGIEPLRLMTDKGILTSDGTSPYTFDWAAMVVKTTHDVAGAIRLLNARYIVLHLDENTQYLSDSGTWTGLAIRQTAGRLDQLHNLRLVFASNTLRVYAVLDWRPFRLFAVKEIGRRPVAEVTPRDIRPLHYKQDGYGRFVVDTGQLRPRELLVINRPFDARWRAGELQPFQVSPGLTAFNPKHKGQLVVSFGPYYRPPCSCSHLPCWHSHFAGDASRCYAMWRRRPEPHHPA